jgi:hypothetical protein
MRTPLFDHMRQSSTIPPAEAVAEALCDAARENLPLAAQTKPNSLQQAWRRSPPFVA